MKIAVINNLKLDNKKILLIALFGLVIVYLDCAFVVKAQLGNLQALTPKVAKLKKEIAAFNSDFTVINSLKAKPGQAGVSEKQVI